MEESESGKSGRRRKPRAVARAARSAPQEVLLPLHETDAVRALSAGVLTGPVVPAKAGLAHELVECWRGAVPAAVVSDLMASAGYGGVLILRTTPAGDQLVRQGSRSFLRLPIAMERVTQVVAESDQYLARLAATMQDFPDVVLDAVPLVVDDGIVSSEEQATRSVPELGMEDSGQAHAPVRDANKLAGAVSGLLAGLEAAGKPLPHHALAAWKSLSSPTAGDNLPALLMRVGSALSLEPPDVLTVEFIRILASKVAVLRTKTGFQPAQLLSEVGSATQPALSGSESKSLERFMEAATPLLKMQPNASKELLLDGGSIMLRGAIAFMRAPSIERLLHLSAKGSSIGQRVGLFAMALAGAYAGCASLERRIKAASPGRLLALGAFGEAAAHGYPLRAGVAAGIPGSVEKECTLELQGRVVATFREPVTHAEQAIRSAAIAHGWELREEAGMVGATIPGLGAFGPAFLRQTVRPPIVPALPCSVLTIDAAIPASRASYLDRVSEAASAHALGLGFHRKGRNLTLRLQVFLMEDANTPADLAAALERLRDGGAAVAAILEAGPGRDRRPRISGAS